MRRRPGEGAGGAGADTGFQTRGGGGGGAVRFRPILRAGGGGGGAVRLLLTAAQFCAVIIARGKQNTLMNI